jgi:hypothetical protein
MGTSDFQSTFEQLRDILRPYEDRLLLKGDAAGSYALHAPFSAKWRRELYFAGTEIKKSYVSFHLMPVYMFPDLLNGIPAELKKRMQGKSCFNFKRVEPNLFEMLAELTGRSFERMAAEGWLPGLSDVRPPDTSARHVPDLQKVPDRALEDATGRAPGHEHQ